MFINGVFNKKVTLNIILQCI